LSFIYSFQEAFWFLSSRVSQHIQRLIEDKGNVKRKRRLMYKMSHHRLHHHPDIYKERKTHLKHGCFGLESCYCHHTESLAEESSTPNHNQQKKKKNLHSTDTRCVTTTSKPYSTFSLNQSSAQDRVIALRGNKTASHLFSSLCSAKRSEAASSSDANKTKINKSLLRKTATRTQTQKQRHTRT
jgi:hypothetical protein